MRNMIYRSKKSVKDQQAINAIFDLQSNYKHILNYSSAEERIAKLRKLQSEILLHKNAICKALYKDFGKPPYESFHTEILGLVKQIDHVCNHLYLWMKRVEHGYSQVVCSCNTNLYEPRGMVLIIGTWNSPLLLLISPLIASLAAGNTSILRPSPLTVTVNSVIRKIISVTFDLREVAVIEGAASTTTELLKKPFNHIFYIGNQQDADEVILATAANQAYLTLQLSGKTPAIIDKSADLDKAVGRIIRAKTLNAGQINRAPDYVLVPKSLQNVFIRKAEQLVQDQFFINGEFNKSNFSQIINYSNYLHIKHLYEDAISKGAKVLMGGVFDEGTHRIYPTILSDVPEDAEIMKEEILSSILIIYNYNTEEEALNFIKRNNHQSSFYLFSENKKNINYYLDHSIEGSVCVNDIIEDGFELTITGKIM